MWLIGMGCSQLDIDCGDMAAVAFRIGANLADSVYGKGFLVYGLYGVNGAYFGLSLIFTAYHAI